MAFSDSRILALGLGPETFKIRPRRAGFRPPGPGEAVVFHWRGRRLQPRVAGPGGGPVLAPSGCPGENSKFANSHFPLFQWTADRGSRMVLARSGGEGVLPLFWGGIFDLKGIPIGTFKYRNLDFGAKEIIYNFANLFKMLLTEAKRGSRELNSSYAKSS